mgnify:CR=1 FL=1
MIDAVPKTLVCLLLAAATGILPARTAMSEPAAVVLQFVESFDLHHGQHNLNEPSALAHDALTGTLWTVSDDGPFLFEIEPSAKIIRKLDLPKEVRDPEAVAMDMRANRILVLSERDGNIISVDLDSPETAAFFPVMSMKGASWLRQIIDHADGAFSPEGMTIDPATGTVFVANEKSPRLLLSITPDLSEILSVETLDADKGFAVPGVKDTHLDISGLAMDVDKRAMWFVSDTGKSLFYRPLGGKRALRYALRWRDDGKERQVRNAEGIAFDPGSRILFVASDDGRSSRLFVYRVR